MRDKKYTLLSTLLSLGSTKGGKVGFLLNQIRPSQSEIDQASKSHNYVIYILKKKGESGDIPPIVNDFLTGSYKRGTKITPLDDVDIFIILNGSGLILYDSNRIGVEDDSIYGAYKDDHGFLSSIKILEAFKRTLPDIYSNVKRDGQALNIWLSSYDIGLDLVPSFTTKDKDYYLIPSGHGKNTWLKTNPQKDEEIVNELDKRHNGLLKDIIRVVKYWNKKKNKNRLRSYHIEAIAVNVFQHQSSIRSYIEGLRIYFQNFIYYVSSCPDPTGLGEPITSNLDRNQINLTQQEINKALLYLNWWNSEGDFVNYLG